MPLPVPEPGLVINYEFLWREEKERGLEHGRKRRPCAIVVAARRESGRTFVIVAPIMHSPPRPPNQGIEIPLKVKQEIGLDWRRAWVILSELNQFVWPGFDLYPVPGQPDRYDYGFLPPNAFREIKARIVALDASLKRPISRD